MEKQLKSIQVFLDTKKQILKQAKAKKMSIRAYTQHLADLGKAELDG